MLGEKGIQTFAQLANTSVNQIAEIMEDAGPRYRLTGPELLESWPQQAKLAAAGKWDELEALQQQVKSKKGA